VTAVVPKSCEENHHDYGQDFGADCFGFLEAFHETIQESSKPEKPLEKCSQHYGSDDGYIDNLSELALTQYDDDCQTHVLGGPWVLDGGHAIAVGCSRKDACVIPHGEILAQFKV
jgi:hypothetical protein